MKNFLLLILLLFSINLFAQDWDDDRHGKDRKHHGKNEYRSNFFTVGLYAGTYIGKYPLYERNRFVNSISIEIEYFKFKDLSAYVRAINQFSKTDLHALEGYTGNQAALAFQEPSTNRFVVSFGARYYLAKSRNKVNPYMQLGINHEVNYIGQYSYIYNGIPFTSSNEFYLYRYSVNIGVGVNVKLGKRFSLDAKYDIYKSLGRVRDQDYNYRGHTSGFNGFSLLAGIKYNL